jgi:hypothetical protein
MATLPTNIQPGDPGHAAIHNATNTEVNLKADAGTVATALANKADAGATNAALLSKANFVIHGSTPGVARPTADFVIWVGTVNPSNSTATDMWLDTSSTNGALINLVTVTNSTFSPTSASNETQYRGNSGSAQTVTLPNNLPAGSNFSWRQVGSGQTTFVAASGGTVFNYDSQLKTAGQGASVFLYVDTNTTGTNAAWVLEGKTAA